VALPDLDADGLLPPGRHVATLVEVEERFITAFSTSNSRTALWAGYLSHRAALTALVPVEAQWLDGSFVTAVNDPGDVDVVSIFDSSQFNALDPATRMAVGPLVAGGGSKVFGCHSFFIASVPGAHAQFPDYLKRRASWDHLWSVINQKHPEYADARFATMTKGYVEIK
jgi:hypothetical protein